MSSCRDVSFLSQSTHCNAFWAFYMKNEILAKLSNSGFYLVIQTEICIWIDCLGVKQFTHFFIFYHHCHVTSLFCTKEHNSHMLDAGQSTCSISAATGINPFTISRLCFKECSELQKSTDGCLKKLSPSNIHHAIHLISTQRAENAVQVTKTLTNIINQPLSPSTTCLHLKKAGMKAVVKTKRPLLSARHRKVHLDFAYAHKDWTLDDWKRVVWSDVTKINCQGSDGRKWVWKKSGEGLSDRLVEGTAKFGGGSIMIWGCMTWEGVGYAAKLMAGWTVTFTFKFWRMNCSIPLSFMVLILLTSSVSRIMTLSTPPKRSRNGWGSRNLGLWCGLHSLLT